MVCAGALRGAGDTRTPMIVTGLVNIINVIVAYTLIFGHFGFPALGVLGSAWGASIARAIGAAVLLGLLFSLIVLGISKLPVPEHVTPGVPGPGAGWRCCIDRALPVPTRVWHHLAGHGIAGSCHRAFVAHLEGQYEDGAAQYWAKTHTHYHNSRSPLCRNLYHRPGRRAGAGPAVAD